jgi:tetrahydromethanopterin S-methyltransferase subunit B
VFKAANGFTDAEPGGIPKPAESVSPGEFRRGYLTSGRAQEHATSHDANIPTTTHPVSPNDFKRGPLTEGHQRYLATKMEEFHDGLTEWKPELCRMDAMGSNAHDRQPAGDFVRGPLLAQVPNGQANGPTPIDPVPTRIAPGEKVEHVPVVTQITAEDIEAAVTKALKPSLDKIASLEETVETMASAPDPNRSASRGVAGQGTRLKVDKIAGADKAQREAARGEKADRRAYYQSMAHSTDPETRTHAVDWLSRKGIEVDD